MPEVSVVIPAYNAERTLAATLRSVIDQSLSDFEVIVVDDGSTDHTKDVALEPRDDRIRVLSVPNGGVSRARNHGIASAASDLVAFLDADDIWLRAKLARQVEVMRRKPNIGMCFVGAMRVDDRLEPIGPLPANDYPDFCDALLLYSVVVSGTCSSGLVRRQLALDIGGFDPAFSQTADWDFWIRLSQATDFAPIADTLVLHRAHAGSMSSDIRLLERDTFAVLDKFFGGANSAPYGHMRSRIYSNHWMICSGSYVHAGRRADAIRCLVTGIRTYPPNVTRPLGFPWRWIQRRVTASPVAA